MLDFGSLGAPITGYPLCTMIVITWWPDLDLHWQVKSPLSYRGIQLIQWVFMGKFSYLMQNSTIQSSCRAIRKKSHGWKWFFPNPRVEGGIGLSDYSTVQNVVIIKRTSRLWSEDDIWVRWMKYRYIQNRGNQQMQFKQRDSVI